jgi:hypothetical protein
MTSILVDLVIPFTFSDEGEYNIRLSGRTSKVKIEHIKNSEGIEKAKGIKIMGTPKTIPDDPSGLYYISNVEMKIPLLQGELLDDWLINDRIVAYVCMRYLNRLTEVIRFATRRYWIRMISQKDIDIFRIKTDNGNGLQPSLFKLGFAEGYIFKPLPIYEQSSRKNLIDKILTKGHRLQLSENLIFDALNNFFSGKFSEAVIIINISLEVFVEEFSTERYKAEGNDENTANEMVDKLFDGKFHKTFRKAFFENLSDTKRKSHPIWIKFENVRAMRKQVMHPHTKIPTHQETQQVFLNIVSIRDWILSLSYNKQI